MDSKIPRLSRSSSYRSISSLKTPTKVLQEKDINQQSSANSTKGAISMSPSSFKSAKSRNLSPDSSLIIKKQPKYGSNIPIFKAQKSRSVSKKDLSDNDDSDDSIGSMGSQPGSVTSPFSHKKLTLQKLNREFEIRLKEFRDIESSMMVVQTKQHEFELEVQQLERSLASLEAQATDSLSQFDLLESLKQNKEEELAQQFKLESQEVSEKFNEALNGLETKYKAQIDYELLEKYNREKQDLTEKVEQYEKALIQVDEELQEKLQGLETLHKNECSKIDRHFENAKADLTRQIYDCDTQISGQKQNISNIEKDFNNYTIKESQLNIQLAKFQGLNQKISSHMSTTQQQKQQIMTEIRQIEVEIEDKKQYVTTFDKLEAEITAKIESEHFNRRKLHNKLLDLKGNIRVFCRVRPPTEGTESSNMKYLDLEGRELSLDSFTFKFDRVFTPTHTNMDIFEEISQLVQSALDGFNVCVFAYGQTGSGKTYTMSSPGSGMVSRAVNQIFEAKKSWEKKGWSYKITGEFLEIYNETIRDLLSSSNQGKKYEIRHDSSMQTRITNLKQIELETPDMVEKLLDLVNKNKSVAATNANQHSSRSHSIFRITIVGANAASAEKSIGVLNLVDLAGSERISHSQVTGARLKETQAINKSLSCLGDVIHALSNHQSHIPFRNSKLTYLLQNSLGGSAKTLMFVNVSPERAHANETLNSLRFAEKVNHVS